MPGNIYFVYGFAVIMVYTSLTDMFLIGTEASFAVLNLYYPEREITVTRSISGNSRLIRLASRILSFDFLKAGWQVDDVALRLFDLEHFSNLGSLRDIAAGQLPPAGLRSLERLSGIRSVYGRSLRQNGRILGNTMVFFRDEEIPEETRVKLDEMAVCIGKILPQLSLKEMQSPALTAMDDAASESGSDPRGGVYVTNRFMALDEEFIPDIYIGLDREMRIVFANYAVRNLGHEKSQVQGKSVFDLLGEPSRGRLEKEFKALLDKGTMNESQAPIIETGRGYRFRLIAKRPGPETQFPGEEVLSLVLREVSKEHLLSAAFLQREEMLRQLADTMSEAVWFESVEPHQILYANPRFAPLFGVSVEELAMNPGLPESILEPGTTDKLKDLLGRKARQPTQLEYTIRPDGRDERWIRIRSYPIISPDIQPLCINIAEDITQERRAHKELKEQYHGARNLLHEMNHRIKNNLSIVAGLTGLAAKRWKDPEIRQEFELLENKISSIALVHEMLRPNTENELMDFGFYCENLLRIISPATADGRPILVESSLTAFPIEPSKAGMLGLILTELITNAAKHAFPEGFADPAIRVGFSLLERSGSELAVLKVADNGPHLDFDPLGAAGPSLGMEIMKTLVGQIKGRITFTQDDGWKEFSVYLKSDKPDTV
jgi:PAS domain S-box-containing protein